MTVLKKIAWCCAVAGTAVAGCVESNPLPADGSGDVHGAWVYMQSFVEKRLKSPATADFPFGGFEDVTDLGGGRYFVDSYVDSENGFGANVRTNFKGYVRKKGETWILEGLEFGEDGSPAANPTPPEPEPAAIAESELVKQTKRASESAPPSVDPAKQAAAAGRKAAVPLPGQSLPTAAGREAVARAAAERKAAAKLRLAEQLHDRDQFDKAKRWYAEIVRDYPGTKAAAAAEGKLRAMR